MSVVREGIRISGGTAASPGVGWRDDEDTGLYRSAANEVSVSCGGTQIAKFTSAGLTMVSGSILGTLDAVLDDLDLGASGNAGTLDIFPGTASRGKLAFAATDTTSGDHTTTITNAAQGGAYTYTIPNAGASADFVMTAGAQTVGGVKTLTSALSMIQGSAAAAADMVLMGGGTNANPNTTSTADKKFIEFRCSTSASSGDNRLMYLRYAITAAGGGECLRAFTALSAASGTVRGAHISLIPSGSGAVSGLGTAITGTLHFGTAAFSTGNVACIEANPYADSTNAPPTEHGCIRVAVGGDATGAALWTTFLHIDTTNVSAADTTKMISTVSLAELPAGTVGIRARIGGANYYIPAVAIAEWN